MLRAENSSWLGRLTGSADPAVRGRRDFLVPRGADLEARLDDFLRWHDANVDLSCWPVGGLGDDLGNTTCRIVDRDGRGVCAVNFVSQDYLNLSSHCQVKAVAMEAIRRTGMHSGGSAAVAGNTLYSRALERRLGLFLSASETVLYPSGWAAGFGAIRALVCASDHVVLDRCASACLQEGASAATRNLHRFPHLDAAYCREQLRKIRSRDTTNGILVVTESLFAVESDVPDLKTMQELCHEFEATLLVDVSHDIGCLGEAGQGQIGSQQMTGRIDLVVGSFAKSLASNGGFVACSNPAVAEYLRFFSPTAMYSHALSPVQAAVVLKALEIVSSDEGCSQRGALMRNARGLRHGLSAIGLEVCGVPSPIVSVKMRSHADAHVIAGVSQQLGLLAAVVSSGSSSFQPPRLRLLVTANHCERNVRAAVACLGTAFDTLARRDLADPKVNPANAEPLRIVPVAA